ncbi:MAG TPA: transketolase C-terminal domain-containing protein [Ignavibacteria bacterium]|nr:transketolase C-terminal domain-containing protein [Ignavibacteria bacterium]
MTYEDLLLELTQKDDRYLVVTAENRAAIRGLPDKIGNKFIDTGITEQTMIGMSAGLALRGRIPITHALATFITMRAFEFIRSDVGIGNLPVKMVGAVPGFLSDGNGPTHQAVEDVSIMRGIPNVNVFCPADEEDMLLGLPQVFASESPFYIRYNNLKPEIEHSKDFEIGKAEIISEGKDATILVYGFLLREAIKAKKLLEDKGYSIGIINLRTVKPIDENAILNSAKNSNMLVTLEDHFITGALYSIVGEIFLKNKVTADVLPIALENKWFKPALLNDVLEYEGFTGEQIARKILLKIERKIQNK